MQEVRQIVKILIVDDEEGVRISLKKVLERDGYEVLLAERGAEGIDIVRQFTEDIETVISDFKMPGMDGLETLTEIGRINPDIIRIILTGYATLDRAIDTVNLGIDGFLTKPFDNNELKQKIREFVIKKRLKQFVSEQVLQEMQQTEPIDPAKSNSQCAFYGYPGICRNDRKNVGPGNCQSPEHVLFFAAGSHCF